MVMIAMKMEVSDMQKVLITEKTQICSECNNCVHIIEAQCRVQLADAVKQVSDQILEDYICCY